MSKVTVITDEAGKIVGIGHGHLSEETAKKSGSREPQAGLVTLPGQQLHEIETPEDVEGITTWSELHEKVRPHVS